MTPFAYALDTSILLAEKIASARPAAADLRERAALADFAAFGLFKCAGINPEALASLQKGLGWGVGLGLPALGVGHLMARDARHQGEELIRDARNQTLLTAAGVGGMQALGNLLKKKPTASEHNVNVNMPPQLDTQQRIAAAIMVDDVLEAACGLDDSNVKHAALVELIKHRSEAMVVVRSYLL